MSDLENAVSSYQTIRRYVEILASSPEVQFDWLVENGYTTAEMWDQLDGSVPSWFPFLRLHVAVSEDLEHALLDFLAFLETTDHGEVWGDEIESLRLPVWDEIRRRASAVLPLF